ncbi:MAG TPA: tripartite tricarboxylate transporter substrate-binding protein, partial [Casimicrobiaceae bacterium]|nr:tripartite tricarboxylate transporter substrate-binding protein [Casimicrobiaceae bacterium]
MANACAVGRDEQAIDALLREKALGVGTHEHRNGRIASAPDLPTIAEQGLPGFDVTSWYALVAPAGTPASIIDRLHQEIAKALAEPDVREKI